MVRRRKKVEPSRSSRGRRYLLQAVLLTVVLAWTAGTLVDIYKNPATQWDLRAFYFASEAHRLGLDPYDPDNLTRISGYRIHHGFIYPPITLYIFRILTLPSYQSAFWVWPIFKLLAIGALLLLWQRGFRLRTRPIELAVVVLLGFNAAMIWDLRSGNISIFEQLLLWSAFVCFLRRRYYCFTALLILVALFKIVLISFLGLLLLPSVRSQVRIRLLVTGFLVHGLLVGLPFLVRPELWTGFKAAVLVRPLGHVNPSFLGLLDMCGDRYPALFRDLPWLPPVLWALFCLVLVIASRKLLLRAWQSVDIGFSLLVAVMLYALLIPRLMVYSYLLLIPPLLVLVVPRAGRLHGTGALVALLCLPGLSQLPARWGDIIVSALPFLLVLAGWFFLVRVEQEPDSTGDDPCPAPDTDQKQAVGRTRRK